MAAKTPKVASALISVVPDGSPSIRPSGLADYQSGERGDLAGMLLHYRADTRDLADTRAEPLEFYFTADADHEVLHYRQLSPGAEARAAVALLRNVYLRKHPHGAFNEVNVAPHPEESSVFGFWFAHAVVYVSEHFARGLYDEESFGSVPPVAFAIPSETDLQAAEAALDQLERTLPFVQERLKARGLLHDWHPRMPPREHLIFAE